MTRPSRLDKQPTFGGFSSVLDESPGRSPGSKDERLWPSSDQDSTSIPMEGRSSESHLVCKDKEKSLSSSNDDLSFSASPLEALEKDRHLQWAGFRLCVGALLTTSQVALGVLRKLTYTQDLVKKMTDKGIPKGLFFWIHHPNPAPLAEKPFFILMVCILAGNLILLYVLMKMLHLIS